MRAAWSNTAPLGEVVGRRDSRLASGLLPQFGRVEVADHEAAEELVLFDDADERLAAAVADGARIEARSTERIGDRRVTRALVVKSEGRCDGMSDSWSEWTPLLWTATRETLVMVGVAMLVTIPFGLLLGVLLLLTDRGGLLESTVANRVLGAIVNVGRSVPFIILLVAVIPLTRALVGTTIGTTAAIVPLALATIPFFARIVETALREVPSGLVEAALASGARRREVVQKVLVPEALPSLVSGVTITTIGVIGYSAMAGAVGGGGLGDVAIRYGYQRYETEVTIATVVVLVVLVQLLQFAGDRLSRRLSHS